MRTHYLIFSLMLLSFTSFAQLKYIGHRGASWYAPENSLAAIRLAFELGADGAECDIRLTGDNQIVLWHDDNTKRLTDQNLEIAKTPYAELKQLKIKRSATNSAFFGEERMPLLKDVLQALPEDQLLVIEIKCGVEIFPHLQKVVQDYWKSGSVAFISFGYETIAMAKSLYPDVPCYFLTSKKEELTKRIPEIIKDKLDGVDLRSKIVGRELVDALRKDKIDVWCWTVDDVEEALRMQESGVTVITTNRPTWLKEQIAVRNPAGSN
ncbi:MAG TPA: glycerophosphodiester phosphodiesterase family protein [Prolixibacteraceae bacterium]|nr:glycerophosphodiester phosphodiesterase family protein [Prolixibacteraceae bacterium]